MNDITGNQPQPQRKPASPAGIFFAVLAAIIVAVWAIAAYAHSHQQVQVTTCNPVLSYCTQTSYPVQSP